MKLKWQQILQLTPPELKSLYILTGKEPMYLQQACNKIRSLYLQNERYQSKTHFIEDNFDWTHWLQSLQTFGLFDEATCHTLYLLKGGLKKEAKECLEAAAHLGAKLVLVMEKLNPKDSWLKAWQDDYAYAAFYELSGNEFIDWLTTIAKDTGLLLNRTLLSHIARLTQNSPYHAAQLVQKASLMPSPIDETSIEAIFSSEKEANIFDLQKALVEKNIEAIRIHFDRLQRARVPAPLINWLFKNELGRLSRLASSQTPQQEVHRLGIHFSQKNTYLRNASSANQKRLLRLYPLTYAIDLDILRGKDAEARDKMSTFLYRFLSAYA